MNKYVIYFLFGVFLVLLPAVNAQQGHMTLLAVSETETGYVGGTADLYLELKPGTGRVFLETFPLTKVDTQMSTRFAKEIACSYTDADCSKFDFFYTITADSSIIGGPSAGAAISALTFFLIEDIGFDENVALTGTINSGGLVGPVGGLKAKIEAAGRMGLKKVLIPIGEPVVDDEDAVNESFNNSYDLSQLEKDYGLEIIEVSTLDDALFEFTGKRFKEKKADLTISRDYENIMKKLAIQLCSRSTKLKNSVSNLTKYRGDNSLEKAINLSERGKESFDENKFYSSASYCFGANVELSYLSLLNSGLKGKGIVQETEKLRSEIKDFEAELEDQEIKTITDLESYMIEKERIIEANEFLEVVIEDLNNTNSSLYNLAYATERFKSAQSWAEFFGSDGKEFDLNDKVIENACRTKLSEVEERLQYVQLYYPEALDSTRKDIEYAYEDLREGNYELCLFKASKAKAAVNSILSVFGVRVDNVDNIINQKLNVVETNLVEEIDNGVFPILGYSYFEYANSLKEDDPFSALLYAEYALELSNLDIYFKSPESNWKKLQLSSDYQLLLALVLGILLGIILTCAIIYTKNKFRINSKKPKKRKHL
jgi:uncharacterized protein